MLAAFSVAPSGGEGADASVHVAVAAAVDIVRRSGLPHRTDSMFTTIEGEWDEVFAVIKDATDAVGEFGTRVSLVVKADIRPGYTGEIDGKLERLETAIEAREQN
ncbi:MULTISPECIES: thiamine-binding protein [unclassified Brevibacterium]|uniref:thiamine-binding protein n=1 Tax=unclassified Brevibacterium TaxID=2614124 RepID=UPI001081657D|nr:thiamine-binding protein [Brevibacterium sp. S111]TGD12037.1 thiamine-binding protein [Brevibacterium sp. S111]